MHDTRDLDVRRREALLCLDWFTSRLLPTQLRRSARCRDRPANVRRDWFEDLRQELAVDCLSRVDEVLSQSPRERHQRWFRLVERWLYREWRHGHTTSIEHDPSADDTRAERSGPAPSSDPDLAEHAARHRTSGRPNLTAVAELHNLPRHRVRSLWNEAAERAGYGAEFLSFWRRRLHEALLGLAADLLLDRGLVRVLPQKRRRPDPRARMRRVRRILRVLGLRPLPVALRAAIATAGLRRGLPSTRPRDLLRGALLLEPGCPRTLLWQFEAALAERDHRAAAACLDEARDGGADPVSIDLARARLLSARGRPGGALALLLRSQRRHPRDPRPWLALRSASRGASLVSARSSAVARSSSSFASGRGDDHVGIDANQPKPR